MRTQRPFEQLEEQARRAAEQAGLCFLADLSRDPTWLFYCGRSGRWLLTYHPRSRRWKAAREQGTARDWREAVSLAVALAERRRDGCQS